MLNHNITFWDKNSGKWKPFQSELFGLKISNIPFDYQNLVCTTGNHLPILRLKPWLYSQLLLDLNFASTNNILKIELEDLYYCTLWVCSQLLTKGFTFVVILLEDEFIIPEGINTIAEALQKTGLTGWLGNKVDLTQNTSKIRLAFEENKYFLQKSHSPSITGVQWIHFGKNNYVDILNKFDRDFTGSSIYLTGIHTFNEIDLIKKLIENKTTIICDEESENFLKNSNIKCLTTPFLSDKNISHYIDLLKIVLSPTSGHLNEENEAVKSSFQTTNHSIQRLMWPDSSCLRTNESQKGLIFLKISQEYSDNIQNFLDSIPQVFASWINGKWIVLNNRLETLDQNIIDHEYRHIIRKIKRLI